MIRSQFYCFLGIITIYIFFCLLPLPNTIVASPTRFLCRRDQRDALLELKGEFLIHTDEDNYATTTSWNKSVDCCSWEGVTCDTILGEVILLNLTFSITNTSLKPSSGLFKLQHLTHLDLSNCHLQREIPSSIGNLSHLTSLDLSFNQLVGEVPASVGNLNQLRYMSLSGNDLRGNIPTSFANLTKLSVLKLDGNNFTGGDIVIANLTSLSEIDISNNHFKSSITDYLSGFHNLERFLGSENSFFGPFPSSLLMIPSLGYMAIGQNQFEGPIDFGNMSSSSYLEVLDVGYNNLDGLIPETISKLVSLYYLDLSHNNFGGRVPSSISKLVNLSSLDLSYNKLEGQVPQFLWRSSELMSGWYYADLSHNSFCSFNKFVEIADGSLLIELDLSSNSLQGPIPQWICNFGYFSLLDLSNNHFTGSIPQCLKNSSMLKLRNNSLSGFLPDFCMDDIQLRSLDVSHNDLAGQLPKSLINCTQIEFLNVEGNKIKDTFPFWLGSLPHLNILVLRSNAFYGPVYNPSMYIGFPSLRIIDISNNNFDGSLPQDYFANWTEMSLVWRPRDKTELMYMGGDSFNKHAYPVDFAYEGAVTYFIPTYQAIDFSGNQFSGLIPGSIGLLSELHVLNLSRNAFTGNIPPSLTNITNLEALDLSRNNLSGEIPQGLWNLSFLAIMNFSHNHLEGLVPQSTQFQAQSCSSFMDNLGLYGLEKICGEAHAQVPTSQQLEESSSGPKEPVMNWIAAAIAFGLMYVVD